MTSPIPTPAALEWSHSFANVAISLNVVAFLVFVGRIWTRSYPVFRLGPDDYIISAAYVLIVVDTILLLLTVPYAFGRDPSSITLADASNSAYYAVLSQPIWSWAMAGIKISVSIMLVRLQTVLAWRRFLWVLITLLLLLAIYNTIVQCVQCVPLRAVWDLLGTTKAKCWSTDAVRVNMFVTASINVVTDFIISLYPITFLRKVQRPLRERAIIGVLMGLGIIAGVASIMKMTAAAQFGKTGDFTLDGIKVGMWSLLEELIGFIAACTPCLRSPFQRALEYFGIVSTHTTHKPTGYSQGYGQMYGDSEGRGTNARISEIASPIKMRNMRVSDAQSEENILPNTDGPHNGGIWCTTEVHLEEERARQQTPRLGRPQAGQIGWDDTSTKGSSRHPSR